MYEIDNKLVDAIWFGKLGIVKARDRTTGKTNRYIWAGDGIDERRDMEYILRMGTKYSEDRLDMIKKRFEPYENFKHVNYEAADDRKRIWYED